MAGPGHAVLRGRAAARRRPRRHPGAAGGPPGPGAWRDLIPSDAVFEVDVTPNRPDCLSHLGLARELAAALGRSLGRDFMPLFTGGVEPPGTEMIDVRIDEPDLCRRYIGAPITGVRVGPSPRWLRRRLWAAGVRPISNVVDVTNYVALEYGQPLHAFDLAKLSGPQIRVRRARAGEELTLPRRREAAPHPGDARDRGRRAAPVAIAGGSGGEVDRSVNRPDDRHPAREDTPTSTA